MHIFSFKCQRLAVWFGVLVLCAGTLSSCGIIVSSASVQFADNLSKAVMNQNDPELVKAGAPAWLLMIDSLLEGEPDNESLLIKASVLYSAYADLFVSDDSGRSHKLTDKALARSFHAMCIRRSEACDLRGDFQEFEAIITSTTKKDVPALFALGNAWAGWIKARRDDPVAIAEIARVETIMNRVVELDETHQDGAGHLYLGVLKTLLPPALGGKPEEGKAHFRRAMDISQGKNFMIPVIYARQYARLVFDRDLHDRLLQQVTDTDPEIDGYVLVNTMAQYQARELLDSSEDYF